jgi:hypothetical protein
MGTSPAAIRTDPSAIILYLNDHLPFLDVDGDGQVKALTDGLLILRSLLGLSNSALVDKAISSAATRLTPASELNYVNSLKP